MRRNLNSAQNIHWTICIPWSHYVYHGATFPYDFAIFWALPIFRVCHFFAKFSVLPIFRFCHFCGLSIFLDFAIFSEHMEQFRQIFPSSYKLVLIWVVLVFQSNTPNYEENTKTLPKMLYAQFHVWLYRVQVMIYYISQNLKGGKLRKQKQNKFCDPIEPKFHNYSSA